MRDACATDTCVGVNRAVPARRSARSVPGTAVAAVRGSDPAIQVRRAMACGAERVRRLDDCAQPVPAVRDAGGFSALLKGVIAEASGRGEVGFPLVSMDSTTARPHHDATGTHLGRGLVVSSEKTAAEEERGRPKGGISQGQDRQDASTDPGREQRRRIRLRFKAHLKAALLGRPRGGRSAGSTSPPGTGVTHWPSA